MGDAGMNILAFLIANWDSVLVALAILAGLIALVARKQFAILDNVALALVTEAEKKYGGGAGEIKLAAVVAWIYPKIPAIIRPFFSAKQIERIIERVLAEAKKKWQANPGLTASIAKNE
jgi:hypothetical protein